MNFRAWILISLMTTAAWTQSAQNNSKGARKKPVHGAGCVEAGVEGGCLILRDLKTKTTYNIHFQENAPKIDTAISFDGTENDNPNICMQAKAVDVTKWEEIKMHCPQPSSQKAHPAAQMASSDAGKCVDWYAWYNTQPATPKSLHVAGMCTFPTSGYSVKLVPHEPRGFNPRIYLFDLNVSSPQGKVSFIITHIPVHYSENTNERYDSVQIDPDHVVIPVHVID